MDRGIATHAVPIEVDGFEQPKAQREIGFLTQELDVIRMAEENILDDRSMFLEHLIDQGRCRRTSRRQLGTADDRLWKGEMRSCRPQRHLLIDGGTFP